MSFLTFVGGVVVFGLLWLLLPRASFMVTLVLLLKKCYEVRIFSVGESTLDCMASILIAIGMSIGFAMDIIECQELYKMFKRWNQKG